MPLVMTRRSFLAVAAGAAASLALSGCSSASDNTVVIYSCGEGEANEVLLEAMHRDLPQYDIRLHYVSTGTCAAKLQNEGTSSEADIVLMLEGGYLRQIQPSLAQLTRTISKCSKTICSTARVPTFPSGARAHALP